MKYLKFNDELINSIHTKRHEDYWDFYLEEFENQIMEYADNFEWTEALEACYELRSISDKFPKKWWILQRHYVVMSGELQKKIKSLQDAEFTIYD